MEAIMNCEVLSEKLVKTRKQHFCFACLRDFPAGSMLYYQRNVDYGCFSTVYTCPTCQKLLSIAIKELCDDDGFPEGCVAEVIVEHGFDTPEEWLATLESVK